MTLVRIIVPLLFLTAAFLPSCGKAPVRDDSSKGKQIIFVIDVVVNDYTGPSLSRKNAGTMNYYSDNSYSADIRDAAVKDRVMMGIGRAMSQLRMSRDDFSGTNEAFARQRMYVRTILENAESVININNPGTYINLRFRDRR